MSRCKLIETCLECSARTLTFVGEVCIANLCFMLFAGSRRTVLDDESGMLKAVVDRLLCH